jgi:HD-like signal output (HDOD) protein
MRKEWKMEFVTKASDALDVLKEDHYDIIVSDMRMPGMDGVKLLEKVRKKYPDVIRFMLSGYCVQPIQGRAARCVHQFIPKPYEAEKLSKLVSRAFALRDRIRSKKATEVLSNLKALPVMPKTYQQVIDKLSSGSSSPREVGKLISRDIGLSSKLLQVANSAFYSNPTKIVDPVRAVVHLGLKAVEGLVLANGIFSKLPEDTIQKFCVDGLQQHSVRVGMLCRNICESLKMEEEQLELATMAGILHDSGKMIMIAKYPNEYHKAIEISRQSCQSLIEVEYELLGLTHMQLGGSLMELWGLPNTIIEAATFHHEPHHCEKDEIAIITAVYAANKIDHEFCSSLADGFYAPVSQEYLDLLGLGEFWQSWREKHLPINIREYSNVS